MKSSGEAVQKIIRELSLRITEIVPIYKPLVLRLKQMVREGIDDEGEILLGVLKQFMNKEIPVNTLTAFWESFDAKVSQAVEHPKYNVLSERLSRGEIIPFLGPDIQHLSEVSLITSKKLTQQLAERAEYPNFSGPLSMISQYYQMTEYGRGTLLRTVQEAIVPQKTIVLEANPLYNLLLNIQQPFIVISASYDNQLEHFFIENAKQFVVISHLREESEIGKVLLKYAERPEPEEPLMADEVAQLRLLENGYSIIYKVCGCFGLYKGRIVEKTDYEHRLLQQKDNLQQQWNLLNEKLSRLKSDRTIETDTEVKFKLDKRIAEVCAEYERVERELNSVEAELLPQSKKISDLLVSQQTYAIDSVLISENDYFGFAKHVERVIPDYLVKQFSQRSLLFLGHNLNEWQDRLILNTILEKKRTRSERSYAVQESPTPYETAYWKFYGVDLYQMNLRTFVEKLDENMLS